MVSDGVSVDVVGDDEVHIINGDTDIEITNLTGVFGFLEVFHKTVPVFSWDDTQPLENLLTAVVMKANIPDVQQETIKNMVAVQLQFLGLI